MSGLEPLPETPRGLRRTALALYLLAALVRLTLLFGFGRYEIARPEPVHIAVSLARNGTFADPYLIPTGPTAHAPPSYPFLIAPIYRILGDTPSADMVRLWLSVLTGSAEYALLPYASASLGMGAVVGALAGLAGAVIPLHYWPESMGEFESPWTALFLQLSVIWFARWMRDPRFSTGWGFRAGLWWGWGILGAPNVLPVLGGFAVMAAASLRPRVRPDTIRCAAAFCLAAIVILMPWTIRNFTVMGGWFLVRDNFGLELSTSNCDGTSPDAMLSHRVEAVRLRSPGLTEYAAAEVKRKGELAFERDLKREAVAWIRSHPLEFAWLTVARIRNFWFPSSIPQPNRLVAWAISVAAAGGLALLWRANRFAAGVLGVVLATYPAIYYLVKNSLDISTRFIGYCCCWQCTWLSV